MSWILAVVYMGSFELCRDENACRIDQIEYEIVL